MPESIPTVTQNTFPVPGLAAANCEYFTVTTFKGDLTAHSQETPGRTDSFILQSCRDCTIITASLKRFCIPIQWYVSHRDCGEIDPDTNVTIPSVEYNLSAFATQKPSQNDAGKTVIVRPTEQSAREYAIAIARVNLLRERLEHCVQKEGVNHHHLCTEERDAYIEWIQKKNNGQLKPS